MTGLKPTLLSLMLATTALLGACSKSDTAQKNDNQITATAPASGEASTLTERNAEQRTINALQANLAKAGIKAKILAVKPTEMPNLYWVTLEGLPAIFATADGKYVLQGELIRLGDDKIHSVGQDFQAIDNKAKFAQLNPKDLIIYPATNGKAAQIIYVFTDANCPYCHKLHGHIAELNDKGIEVRYIAWPRGEQFFPTMQSIWCSSDRKAAFDQAIKGMPLPPATCQSPVMAQYQLGTMIGVNGTPAIYSQDGHYLTGYAEPDDIIKRLNEK